MPQSRFQTAILLLLAPLFAACQGAPPANLGLHQGQLRPCPASPNCYASAQVGPWPWKGDVARTRQALLAAARQRDGQLQADQGTYLHFLFLTRWWRFGDDVEWVINEAQGQVEFMSASRLGYYDFGVNRRRMLALQAVYEEAP